MQAELVSIKELTDTLEQLQSSNQEALFAKKQVCDFVQQMTDKYKKLNIQPVESSALDYQGTFSNVWPFVYLC